MADTLTPHIARYLRERRGQGTYRPYSIGVVRGRLNSLSAHHGGRSLDALTKRRIELWLASLSHLSQGSRSSYLSSVRTFCGWLHSTGVIDHDPTIGVPPIRRPRPLPRAQEPDAIAALLAACETQRDRLLVVLAVELGLRRGELARLRWEDYSTRDRTLYVRGKGGSDRWVPVTSAAARELASAQTATTGPVIASYTSGRPITPEAIGKRVSGLLRAAGVKAAAYDGVSLHALRHTAASDVLDASGDLRAVQAMLGHRHLSTTEVYLRRADLGRVRAAMEARVA